MEFLLFKQDWCSWEFYKVLPHSCLCWSYLWCIPQRVYLFDGRVYFFEFRDTSQNESEWVMIFVGETKSLPLPDNGNHTSNQRFYYPLTGINGQTHNITNGWLYSHANFCSCASILQCHHLLRKMHSSLVRLVSSVGESSMNFSRATLNPAFSQWLLQ